MTEETGIGRFPEKLLSVNNKKATENNKVIFKNFYNLLF